MAGLDPGPLCLLLGAVLPELTQKRWRAGKSTSIWVVLKIMVPWWVRKIVRHLVFRGPKKKTIILTTTHMGGCRSSSLFLTEIRQRPGSCACNSSTSSVAVKGLPEWGYMGGCQNYGPLLGPLNTRCRIMLRTPKGTIILITTHIPIHRASYPVILILVSISRLWQLKLNSLTATQQLPQVSGGWSAPFSPETQETSKLQDALDAPHDPL